MIEIVSTTRHDENSFWDRSALGRSLTRLSADTRLTHFISFENKIGLGEIYNRRITAISDHDILVFIHDDIWIDDPFFADELLKGLEHYDIIGVAGNRRRALFQPSWCFIDEKFTCDKLLNLSGSVAHGPMPNGPVSHYGDAPADCELMDGALLAVRRSKLTTTNVYFDPTFRFHFYDMDFCRTARQKGLRLGTWRIAITHQSPGNFGSAEWKAAYAAYLHKWKT